MSQLDTNMSHHRKLVDLLVDKNRFRNVLEFTNDQLTTESIKNTANPFLADIRNKLQDPTLKRFALEKSLLLRNPEVRRSQLKSLEVHKTIKHDRTIPEVPLHKMDKLTRHIAQSLLEEVGNERVKDSEWRKQEVMLPILNTFNKNIELHSSLDLNSEDIRAQRKVYNCRQENKPVKTTLLLQELRS